LYVSPETVTHATPVSVGRAVASPTSPPFPHVCKVTHGAPPATFMCLHLGHLMADLRRFAERLASHDHGNLLGRGSRAPNSKGSGHDLRPHPSGRARDRPLPAARRGER